MNQQLKSHWKLAYRSTKKAVKVTFSVFVQMFRAKIYRVKNEEKLLKQRAQLTRYYHNWIERNFS